MNAALLAAVVRRTTPTVGTVGSLVALVLMFHDPTKPIETREGVLIVVALVLGAVAIAIDVRTAINDAPKIYSSRRAIRDYMYRWIESAGRTAIFTRDLSWVEDDQMRNLLDTKARAGDLTVVLPRPIDLSDRLGKAGARIVNYPDFGYVIRSRFTIVDIDRAEPRVAIGYRRPDGRHQIEEFGAGDHPAFGLAVDMYEIVQRMSAAPSVS